MLYLDVARVPISYPRVRNENDFYSIGNFKLVMHFDIIIP